MITANGHPVLAGSVHMPRTGCWHADLELDHDEPLSGAVVIDADGTTFRGTVTRGGALVGAASVRVAGGTGGLRQSVGAQAYVASSAETVIRDLLGAVGESLSATSNTALLARTLGHWHRAAGPAGTALSLVTRAVGATWRMLADGTVWVGVDTYPAQVFEHVELDPDPLLGTWTLQDDAWHLRPGVSIGGRRDQTGKIVDARRVSRVEHSVGSRGRRTTYWVDESEAPGSLERIQETLRKVIRNATAETAYHCMYSAIVQRQDAEGLLDLMPDDPEIRGTGTSKVPIRHGLPGCQVRVPVGSEVLLGFEDGDPSKPFAALWRKGDVQSISLPDGARPVARQGDPVVVYFPPSIPVSGTLNGAPFAGTMVITSSAPGIIIGPGNPKVLA